MQSLKLLQLKGHQIIGELRLAESWVFSLGYVLKGHQIIGELRPIWRPAFKLSDNWRVTRSLVSYDHCLYNNKKPSKLKGHQIIGELRPKKPMIYGYSLIEGSPDHWWVTTYLWYYCCCGCGIEGSPDHWWVTTTKSWIYLWYYCIEGSPDHWWVTTSRYAFSRAAATLKGHQIIGELRHSKHLKLWHRLNWRVTRSLVSYDIQNMAENVTDKNWRVTRSLVSYDLKRRWYCYWC